MARLSKKVAKPTKRVLVRIPAGNGVPVDRFTAVGMEEAKELIRSGSQDKNSWFAGAHVIDDPKEYSRYGYKECERNGVIMDDDAIHLTAASYDKYLNAQKRVDDLEGDTAGSMLAQMKLMAQKIDSLESELSKSQQQKQADAYVEAKDKLQDEALVNQQE